MSEVLEKNIQKVLKEQTAKVKKTSKKTKKEEPPVEDHSEDQEQVSEDQGQSHSEEEQNSTKKTKGISKGASKGASKCTAKNIDNIIFELLQMVPDKTVALDKVHTLLPTSSKYLKKNKVSLPEKLYSDDVHESVKNRLKKDVGDKITSKMVKEEIEKMWKALPKEAQDVYTKKSKDSLVEFYENFDVTTCPPDSFINPYTGKFNNLKSTTAKKHKKEYEDLMNTGTSSEVIMNNSDDEGSDKASDQGSDE